MSVVNINGAWKSTGNLIYVITQLADETQIDDKFVWRAIHTNGVTETGIGWFVKPTKKEQSPELKVRWNFHGGNIRARISRPCRGNVIMDGNSAVKIEWTDHDHFESRIGNFSHE